MSKVSVAVIGVGHMGRYHVNALASMDDVNLVGVCDINEKQGYEIADRYKTKYFRDVRDLFGRVDAVVVAVPTFLHYYIASEFIKRGVHVLVEKPITRSINYAKKLIDLSSKYNVVLQVGHIERYNGAVQELRNIVTKPLLIEARRMGPKNTRIRDVGVVLDLMVHDLDIVLNVIGKGNKDIIYIGASGIKVYSDYEDVANATIVFSDETIANITASRVTENKRRILQISQEGSFIEIDYSTQDITIYRQASSDYILNKDEIKYVQEAFIEKVFVKKEDALKRELRHFINCVLGKEKPMFSNELDLKTHTVAKKIMDIIYSQWRANFSKYPHYHEII
ncbi:MAG: Gfo/Idh/MocA family oxidoreductase [Brevinematales bacterium]|nr:Gfo/Idh/MocA family oxidoreductase [Brevinematales bacterium]